jgi:hypothetical protein
MLLKKSKYRQRVIDKAAFAAGFVAPANVAGFHLELLQIEAALLKYLSLWEATVGAHAGDVSISWRAPLEICDIIGTHCDENDDFVLFYNKLSRSVYVEVDYNPYFRQFLGKVNAGIGAAAAGANLDFGFERSETAVTKTGEKFILAPGQIQLVQISGNIQVFATVTLLDKRGREIGDLFSTKRLWELQALIIREPLSWVDGRCVPAEDVDRDDHDHHQDEDDQEEDDEEEEYDHDEDDNKRGGKRPTEMVRANFQSGVAVHACLPAQGAAVKCRSASGSASASSSSSSSSSAAGGGTGAKSK